MNIISISLPTGKIVRVAPVACAIQGAGIKRVEVGDQSLSKEWISNNSVEFKEVEEDTQELTGYGVLWRQPASTVFSLISVHAQSADALGELANRYLESMAAAGSRMMDPQRILVSATLGDVFGAIQGWAVKHNNVRPLINFLQLKLRDQRTVIENSEWDLMDGPVNFSTMLDSVAGEIVHEDLLGQVGPLDADDNLITQVRYIDEYSVVRMKDGRVGILAKHTARKKPIVKLTSNYGVEISPSEQVEVLMRPAQLAGYWMEHVAAVQVKPAERYVPAPEPA